MALIKITDATVKKAHGTRGAFIAEETIEIPDGRSFPRTYIVWNTEAMPAIGAKVNVTGELTVKPRTIDDGRTFVDISINNPQIEQTATAPF